MHKILFVVLLSFVLQAGVAFADQQSFELSSGDEVIAEVYGAASDTRVLWIGSGFGLSDRHKQVAEDLGRQGMQVWQVDLIESLFLVRGAQAMREIDASVVADLINAVSENGKYRLLLISGTYGSIPTLRGVHAWQATKPKKRTVIGVVLFSPFMFTQVPDLGEAPQFVEVTRATSVPVFIFQAEKAGNRWHLPALVTQLNMHAPVFTEMMRGVTSLYFPEDKPPQTLKYLETVADKIKKTIPKLGSQRYPLEAVPLEATDNENKLGLDDRLKAYSGSVKPVPFSLEDVKGQAYVQKDFKGKVRVINFWATWCPPCVEEIPSLNRLREKMQGKAFELISIDYAESSEKVSEFMQQVAVDFPVLIDPDGRTAGEWQVVSFPSTFVIGPDGRIRYGVNAAIHWDTDDIVTKLNALLP